jgi:spermidine synthase
VLESDPLAHVEAIDLAEDVIATARDELGRAGFGSRIRLHVGDVRGRAHRSPKRFDLVMLLNNIYYFDSQRRAELYRDIAELLTERGQLIIVSMMAPGSVAAAHLHFMLTCQSAVASLPRPGEIERDLSESGFRTLVNQLLVPSEPFVGVRAIKQ